MSDSIRRAHPSAPQVMLRCPPTANELAIDDDDDDGDLQIANCCDVTMFSSTYCIELY